MRGADSRGGADVQGGRSSRIAVLALAVAWALAAPGARGQEPPGPAPEVPLENLFKLPESVATTPAGEPRRGGKTRAEWHSRFAKAQADVAKARQALEASRKELEKVAPDQAWSMTAPGLPVQASPSETSIDFRLRQEIRRQREDLERAERTLDELSVEANLAGVPEEWRPSAPEPEPGDAAPEPRAAKPGPSARSPKPGVAR
jgi:hypothetical protein